MIDQIRQILPYLFALFFIIKSNKEPLYLLGIPFLMFMSNSIFFENAKIFQKPGNLSYALKLIWLIGLWILALSQQRNKKRDILNSYNFNIIDFCIISLVLISIIDLIRTFTDYPITDDVFEEFITLISLFVGYFIIKDWSSRNVPELILKFLFSLVIINSISSVLYFLHQGLHFNIYLNESMQDTFNGENITRGFYFMPQFLFFSIIFCLIFQKNYPVVSWILLGINVLAVYISYTRSYLIIVVLIFLLYFVFTGLKRKKLAPVFKNIFLYSILAIIAVFVISKIFPNKTKYFQERFTELTKRSSPMDGPNDLEYRFMNAEDIISTIKENKKMLGMGPISEKQSPKVTEMKNVTADMVWTGVIYRWGFVGLTLFALIYLFSLFYSFKLYINSEKAISDMALLFLLYIISQIIESFVSWTFMSGHGLTTGFWYFGMLSAILKLYSSPFSYLNKKHPNKFLLKSSH